MAKRKQLSDYLVMRKRAIELHKCNKKQGYISAALGVGQSTVSGWIQSYRTMGEESFNYDKVGGSKRKLSENHQKKLVEMLTRGAVSCGYEGDIWTRGRVIDLIEKQFQIKYALTTVGELLKALGFTVQKPDKRSYKQDPEKVKQWQEVELPQLKKKP
jgi:transposase